MSQGLGFFPFILSASCHTGFIPRILMMAGVLLIIVNLMHAKTIREAFQLSNCLSHWSVGMSVCKEIVLTVVLMQGA